MKAQPALVGPDGAVHLDAEAAVDLDFPLVVHPGHPEHDDPFRFYDAFEYFRRPVFRMAFQHEGE